MNKTPQQIEISKEAEVMLNEIRNKKEGFDLSAEVEALVRSIHAETTESGNTKPAKEQLPQTVTNSGKGSNAGNFSDWQTVVQNVIHIHTTTDAAQLSETLTRLFPFKS